MTVLEKREDQPAAAENVKEDAIFTEEAKGIVEGGKDVGDRIVICRVGPKSLYLALPFIDWSVVWTSGQQRASVLQELERAGTAASRKFGRPPTCAIIARLWVRHPCMNACPSGGGGPTTTTLVQSEPLPSVYASLCVTGFTRRGISPVQVV